MEAATKERELSGEKAQRIVDAMRESVAKRGAAGSTFEHVAREAGVSRGLLHYYFGTKERLLVEVVRRDAEIRVARLDEPLAKAETVDDVLDVLVSSLTDLIENEPAFFLLLYELFSAGRRNPEIQRRGRPALRAHPLPRRRGARGEGARGRAQASATTPRRSSPTSSRSATASPCRRSRTPIATSARRSPPAPRRLVSCSPAASELPHRRAAPAAKSWLASQCASR